MNKSKRSSPNIYAVAIVAFGLWLLLLAVAQPLRLGVAGRLAQSATAHTGVMQQAELRVAIALSPHYDGYRLQLADSYLRDGNTAGALDLLHTPNTSSIRLKRAGIELATGHADRAVASLRGLQDIDSAILVSKAYLELDKPTEALNALRAYPEATAQIMLCQSIVTQHGVELAYELRDAGLPLSAMRVAQISPDTSVAKYSLLADLTLHQSTNTVSIRRAIAYLRTGMMIDPSNLPLHHQLLGTLKLDTDTAAVQQEQSIIQLLESGSV